MTLAVAQQWGDRILIISDTMISDRNATRLDVIPGRLKTVVVSREMAISYAGFSNPALDVIRSARGAFLLSQEINDVLTLLQPETKSGELEFIVATHVPTPRLYKVSAGQIFTGSDRYWIGIPEAMDQLTRLFDEVRAELGHRNLGGEYWTAEEALLTHAFIELADGRTAPRVGGFVFICLGSPLGYCYQNHASAVSWYPIPLGVPYDEEARCAFERTGEAHYEYSLTSARARGIAITGAFLPQAALGYLYSPLEDADPCKIYPATLEGLNQEIGHRSARLVGLLEDGQE